MLGGGGGAVMMMMMMMRRLTYRKKRMTKMARIRRTVEEGDDFMHPTGAALAGEGSLGVRGCTFSSSGKFSSMYLASALPRTMFVMLMLAASLSELRSNSRCKRWEEGVVHRSSCLSASAVRQSSSTAIDRTRKARQRALRTSASSCRRHPPLGNTLGNSGTRKAGPLRDPP